MINWKTGASVKTVRILIQTHDSLIESNNLMYSDYFCVTVDVRFFINIIVYALSSLSLSRNDEYRRSNIIVAAAVLFSVV